MKKYLALIVAATLVGAAWAQAAEKSSGNPALKTGVREVALSGNYDPDAADDYSLNLNAAYGQFVIDNLELGVRGLYKGSDHIDIEGIQGFAEYNLDLGSKWVPYGRVAAGWLGGQVSDPNTTNDESADTSAFAVAGGVKYFITEWVALGADVEYTKASDDIFVNDDGELEDDDVEVNLSLRIFLP